MSQSWVVGAPIPFPAPSIGAPSFVLRAFRSDDFASAHELDAQQAEPHSVEPLPESDGPSMARECERNRSEGTMLQLVIADPDTDRYLGEIVLTMLEPGTAEIGCVVVPAARGRGIGTAALCRLAAWGLETLSLRRVQAAIDVHNGAALRMTEKAGFRREGVMRAYWEVSGDPIDAVLLSRLPGDAAPDHG